MVANLPETRQTRLERSLAQQAAVDVLMLRSVVCGGSQNVSESCTTQVID